MDREAWTGGFLVVSLLAIVILVSSLMRYGVRWFPRFTSEPAYRRGVLRWVYGPPLAIGGLTMLAHVLADDLRIEFLALGGVVLLAHLTRFLWWYSRMKDIRAMTSTRFGLTTTAGSEWYLTGDREGVAINLQVQPGLMFGAGYIFFQATAVPGSPPVIPRELQLQPERLVHKLDKRSGGLKDHLTGDPDFDSKVLIGRMNRGMAVLNSSTRKQILAFFEHHPAVQIKDGTISLHRFQAHRAERTQAILDEMCALAQSLMETTAQIPQRLADNALTDPVEAVALNQFRKLVGAFPEEARRVAIHVGGRMGRDYALRLEAACFLKEAGVRDLLALLKEAGVPAGLWSQVITALGPYLAWPPALPARKAVEDALCGALAHDAADVRVAASKSLVAHNPILGRVAVLTHRGHQRTAFERALAAQLLSATWCEAGESWLVDMLNDDEDTVVLAAIDALGKMGTVVAVEPLVLCGQRDSSFKRSAVEAIADIQDRLGDVDGGRLSLSTTSEHAGALSVGQTPGAVSLDTDEPTS